MMGAGAPLPRKNHVPAPAAKGKSMKHRSRCIARTATVSVLVSIVTAACGSPTSPTGATESVTWTVNGESFRATSNGRAASRAGGSLSVVGADCGRGANLHVQVRGIDLSIPGTYPVGQSDGQAIIQWTPDARSGDAASESWQAPGIPRVVGGAFVSGGTGSVTVTSISNDWVSGTFRVEVVPNPGNRDITMKAVEGSFELSFRERVLC
jgi:hypothetical protein